MNLDVRLHLVFQTTDIHKFEIAFLVVHDYLLAQRPQVSRQVFETIRTMTSISGNWIGTKMASVASMTDFVP